MRLVKCNHLDLSRFQFDHDLTFAVFFLNPEGTLYARYGSRTGQDADEDVSLEGLAATMTQVLDLHRNWPGNRDLLVAKQPRPVARRYPEEYPALQQFRPELDHAGETARTCIHCHQVRDAARIEWRGRGQPWPLKLLFPWPAADRMGLILDVDSAATIREVVPGSPAARAGVLPGDQLETINGSDISSPADVSWILHHLADDDSLQLGLDRRGVRVMAEIGLPPDWRQQTDISWRPTSWDLRRMATGGMVLHAATVAEREGLGIDQHAMALRVGHVGQYGDHGRANRAGLRTGDWVVGVDDRDDLPTESALVEYAIQEKRPGETLTIHYLRGGHRRTTSIELQ